MSVSRAKVTDCWFCKATQEGGGGNDLYLCFLPSSLSSLFVLLPLHSFLFPLPPHLPSLLSSPLCFYRLVSSSNTPPHTGQHTTHSTGQWPVATDNTATCKAEIGGGQRLGMTRPRLSAYHKVDGLH